MFSKIFLDLSLIYGVKVRFFTSFHIFSIYFFYIDYYLFYDHLSRSSNNYFLLLGYIPLSKQDLLIFGINVKTSSSSSLFSIGLFLFLIASIFFLLFSIIYDNRCSIGKKPYVKNLDILFIYGILFLVWLFLLIPSSFNFYYCNHFENCLYFS